MKGTVGLPVPSRSLLCRCVVAAAVVATVQYLPVLYHAQPAVCTRLLPIVERTREKAKKNWGKEAGGDCRLERDGGGGFPVVSPFWTRQSCNPAILVPESSRSGGRATSRLDQETQMDGLTNYCSSLEGWVWSAVYTIGLRW